MQSAEPLPHTLGASEGPAGHHRRRVLLGQVDRRAGRAGGHNRRYEPFRKTRKSCFCGPDDCKPGICGGRRGAFCHMDLFHPHRSPKSD
jgi:hypothetical protein